MGAFLYVGAFHYFVRPHLLTIGLLGWTMMCVIDYENGSCTIWRLVGLVPLFVLWTNLHPGVLGGIMTLGLAIAGWGLLFLFGQPGTPVRNWPSAFAVAGVGIGCLLAPLVNPHGMELFRTWQYIVGSRVLPRVILEHMPMDPTKFPGKYVAGLGLAYVFLLLGTLPKRPKIGWLIPLVWLVLGFKSIRHAPLFVITAAVAVADLWPHTLWHRWLAQHGTGTLVWTAEPGSTNATTSRGRWWWVVPAFLVLVSLGLQVTRVPVPLIGHGWACLDADFVPVDLNDEVTKYAESVPPGTPIFNEMYLGGYLIFHAPRLKVFIDDRCELYQDDWIWNYDQTTVHKTPEEFGQALERWADEYGFQCAIILSAIPGKDPPVMEQYFLEHPDRWREVARGKRGVMFERVSR